jgi:hypothetical protein
MARPKRDVPRDKMIGVYVTPEELELIRVAAFRARTSLAGYLRDVALKQAAKAQK